MGQTPEFEFINLENMIFIEEKGLGLYPTFEVTKSLCPPN